MATRQRGGSVPLALQAYRNTTAVKCEELIRRFLDDDDVSLADKVPIALKYSINYEANQLKRELGSNDTTNNILILMQQAAKEVYSERNKQTSHSRLGLVRELERKYDTINAEASAINDK